MVRDDGKEEKKEFHIPVRRVHIDCPMVLPVLCSALSKFEAATSSSACED